MDAFLKYPGGKANELRIIKKYLPNTIKRYFEPFVGGGSVYLGLNIKESFINDKSKDLMDLYAYIKRQDNAFKKRLIEIDSLWKEIETKTTKEMFDKSELDYQKFVSFLSSANERKNNTIAKFSSKGIEIGDDDRKKIKLTAIKTAFYMLIRDVYNTTNSKLEKIVSFYFLREYCYSSMFRFSKSGNFNVPYGGMSYNNKYMTSKINRMFSIETKDFFKNTTLSCDDFELFLKRYDLNEFDFIFLDPPYDSDFSTYDNNSFDKNEQTRLRDFLKKTKAKWMLVIKNTDFISDLYKDFFVFKYDKSYMVSFKNRNDKQAEHLLISNYEIKEEL